MTDPSWPGGPENDWQRHQPPPEYPPRYPPQGMPGGYVDPTAPFGRHPVTGEPLSDKSKVIAGLLQLIGLFGFLGFGRMYLGNVGLGIAQLLTGLLVSAVTCGYGVVVPIVWAIVEAILILTGKVRDPQGRPLRDGI